MSKRNNLPETGAVWNHTFTRYAADSHTLKASEDWFRDLRERGFDSAIELFTIVSPPLGHVRYTPESVYSSISPPQFEQSHEEFRNDENRCLE